MLKSVKNIRTNNTLNSDSSFVKISIEQFNQLEITNQLEENTVYLITEDENEL